MGVPLSPDEELALLKWAADVKGLGADPVALLEAAARAEAWMGNFSIPPGWIQPDKLVEILRAGIANLNVTNSADPLLAQRVRRSLAMWRMLRRIGTLDRQHFEALDEIGRLLAVQPDRPGRPDRPLYMNEGDYRDWLLFQDMQRWVRTARSRVPTDLRKQAAIERFLSHDGRAAISDLPDSFRPGLSRALQRLRHAKGRGELSPKQAAALWYLEYKKNKPVPTSAVEAADREVDRLSRLVNRWKRQSGGPKPRT